MPKKNNHTHKIVFAWFDNVPTSTELQGYHYYQERMQSTFVGYNISSLSKTQPPHHTKNPNYKMWFHKAKHAQAGVLIDKPQ